MTNMQDNLDQYNDLLEGLERLAQGIDAQRLPEESHQRVLKPVVPAPVRSGRPLRLPILVGTAAAALLVAALTLYFVLAQQGQGTKDQSMGPLASAPAYAVPADAANSADDRVLKFAEAATVQVPSVSMPSMSEPSSVSMPSSGGLSVPSIPQNGAASIEFQIPSISFPSFSERSNT